MGVKREGDREGEVMEDERERVRGESGEVEDVEEVGEREKGVVAVMVVGGEMVDLSGRDQVLLWRVGGVWVCMLAGDAVVTEVVVAMPVVGTWCLCCSGVVMMLCGARRW